MGLVEEVDVDELGIAVLDELDLSNPLSWSHGGECYKPKINPCGSPFNMRKCHGFVINAG